MPRPRLPTEVLELNRSFAKNPNRKRAAPPKSTHPLGNPPTDFSAAEKKCWAEIVKYVPANVLTGADRMAVEILSRLMAQFRSREPMKASDLAVLVSLLGKMGMTPCDREKVHANKTESAEENPFAEFSVN